MAQKTGSKRHTHKYHRDSLTHIWKCALPDCTHFMPLNVGDPIGKMSICWHCGNEMVLDEDNMKYEQPWCSECKGIPTASITDFLTEKGI